MSFSEEQRALAGVAAELFASVSSPSRLRAVWEAGGERGDADGGDVWPRLAELGLTSIGVPEEFGGYGGGLTDLVLVCEEAGAAALPEPLLESVVVAGPLLAESGTEVQQEEWLPRLASGDAVATVRLAGQPFVVDADLADVLLLDHDGELLVCELDDVSLQRVPTEDRARRLFTVDIHGGTPLQGTVSGDGVRANALARARVGTAAMLNGVSRRLVGMAVDYAKVREQFGTPIGSFQAIQQLLADLHVAVDSTRATAWAAAAAIDAGDEDAPRLADVAKAAASSTGRHVNTQTLQVFGGIGFTWEHDLHMWLKRSSALAGAYGTSRDLHRRLGRDLITDRQATT